MNKIVIEKSYLILKSEEFNLCEEIDRVEIDEDGYIVDENGSPLIYDKETTVIEPFGGISLRKDSNNEMMQILINVNEGQFTGEMKNRYDDVTESKIKEIEDRFGLLGVIVGTKENTGLAQEGIKDIETLESEDNLKRISFKRNGKDYFGIQFQLEDESSESIYLTYVYTKNEESLKTILEGIEELEEINSKAYEN